MLNVLARRVIHIDVYLSSTSVFKTQANFKSQYFFRHLADVQKEMKAKQLKKTENTLMSYQALFFSLSALWGLHLKFNNW